MAIGAFLGKLIEPVMGVISEFVPDKDKQMAIRSKIFTTLLANEADIIKEQASIIRAEANSDSWLTANWRPMVMLFLMGLVGAHWLGFTGPNVTPEQVEAMLGIVKVGLGGYVVGRSAEKFAKNLRIMVLFSRCSLA